MSFVDAEDIQGCVEGYIQRLFKEVMGVDIPLPLPRLTFADAMNRYGSDKPDTRFGFEIQDISETVKDIDFVVFKNALDEGGSVRAINVKGGAATYTRKEIDKLVEHAKGIGAKGLAYIRWADEPNCSFKKFLGEGDLERICEAVNAENGDLVLICADKNKVVLSTLGAIRLIAAKRLEVFDMIKYVAAQNCMRISTGKLNDVLAYATARVQPPSDKGKRLKIYYMTQASTKPPTFVVFVNRKDLFHFSYQRYLENQIRETFGLDATPIVMSVRERDTLDVK